MRRAPPSRMALDVGRRGRSPVKDSRDLRARERGWRHGVSRCCCRRNCRHRAALARHCREQDTVGGSGDNVMARRCRGGHRLRRAQRAAHHVHGRRHREHQRDQQAGETDHGSTGSKGRTLANASRRESGQFCARRQGGRDPIGKFPERVRTLPTSPTRQCRAAACRSEAARAFGQRCSRRRRSALRMTDTELKVIAALARIGLSSTPNVGYRTPAATGTPSVL